MDRDTTDPRWSDDARDRKARAIVGTLERSVGRLPGGQWLDLGCGSGDLAAELARLRPGARVTGIDPEPWARWKDLGEAPGAPRFLQGGCGEATRLVGAASMDVVICNQVYEHVPSVRELLDAIHAVLRPGGVCYFAGPNLLWPVEPHVFWPFVHWLPRRFAVGLMRACGSRRAADLDAWSLDWWRLTRLIKVAGLYRQDAIKHRLSVVAGNSAGARAARAIARLPRRFFAAAAPVSPAFVFVLRKPGAPSARQP
ncbi:MAG: hypothetical protein CL625_00425 [Arenimonas sp.]|jgi:SAM-dependent methyltransferase|nr:hypothetical protein [Arenimonas sp.]